jgi:UDP-N-acetylglucosamine--N-acetylmuramyl-(pentapeptide) pyrophosphoryl-undecaprenol N-acetylglucosamine transferase
VKVVLSGGGTGGHIYPGLAVAEALREHGGDRPPELFYIGAEGRMDESLVKASGLPFGAIRAAPLRVTAPIGILRGLINLLSGTIQAWRILDRIRPDVVFATGGYASVPVGVAARLRRLPLLVYLPDITPGWSVRLLSRLANRLATTTERPLAALPPGKTTVTGYPVRRAFWSADRDTARDRLGVPRDALVLMISGASQGAHTINVVIEDRLRELLDVCHVLHLTGRADEAAMLAARDVLPESMRERYHVFGFQEDMASAMAASDLAVMRAGASVLGEVPAAGLPVVLVPGVYEGGYNQNAIEEFLVGQGSAVFVHYSQLGDLIGVVRELLADGERRLKMAGASRKLARPEAARHLASMLMEMAA